MRIRYWPAVLAVAILTAIAPAQRGAAQDKSGRSEASSSQPARQYPVPQAEQLVLMIRLSLLTLNDAIQTGNYSVLRDRGGPSFRQTNTAARLARIFTNLEAQRVDLAPVAVLMPQLSEAQIAGQQQHLRVKGHFPTQPAQINFDLIYEPADGHWQLFGISVGTAPAPKESQPAAAAKSPPKPEPKKSPSNKSEKKAAPTKPDKGKAPKKEN